MPNLEIPFANFTVRAVLRPATLPTQAAPSDPEHVENKNWTMLLCLPLVVWGFIGNSMVCIAIYTDKRLQNVTNYFLFSLAIADLLVCSFVMPLSIWLEVNNGVWYGNFELCLVYSYADVFLCSASIVHMSVISLDRYLGISNPFKMRNKSRTVVLMKILTVWIITVIISSPLAAFALYNQENLLQGKRCQIFNRYFMIYGSILAFLIPFIIMIITYSKTTNLLSHQSELLSAKSAGAGEPVTLRRTITSTNRRSMKQNQPNSGSRRPSTVDGRLAPDRPDISTSVVSTSVASPSGRNALASMPGRQSVDKRPVRGSLGSRSIVSDLDGPNSQRGIQRIKDRTCDFLLQIAKKASRNANMNEQQRDLANERKATRVLGVVFGCFFICWTPFFAMNFTVAFCGKYCENNMPPILPNVVLWLGYISSTINPVIYTIFNKKFRQTFSAISRCRCCLARNIYKPGVPSNWRPTAFPDTITNGSAAGSLRFKRFNTAGTIVAGGDATSMISSGKGTPVLAHSPPLASPVEPSATTYRRRLSEPLSPSRTSTGPELSITPPSTHPTTLPITNEEESFTPSKASMCSPINSSLSSDDEPQKLPSDGSDCERLIDTDSSMKDLPAKKRRRKVTYQTMSTRIPPPTLIPKSRSMPLKVSSRPRNYYEKDENEYDKFASLGPLLQSCEETMV